MQIDVVSSKASILGESPVWSPSVSSLFWVDIVGGCIHRLEPASGRTDRWVMPDIVSGIELDDGETLIVALSDRLCRFDPLDGSLALWCRPEPDSPGNRSNELRRDASGRLWLGTMARNFGPDGKAIPMAGHSGRLYSVDRNGASTVHLRDIGIPNSLAWSPDGRVMYFADTLTGRIDAFDFELATGSLSNRRPFARGGDGYPDGSAVDCEGHLWNARWDGGCIIRYRPDGGIDRVVKTPMRRPTSCTFGGDDRGTLFVTSAMSDTDEPVSRCDGHVIAMNVGVRGIVASR